MEKNDASYLNFIRTYLEKKIGKEKARAFLLLLFAANPNESVFFKYSGFKEEQSLFPHKNWALIAKEKLKLSHTVISQHLKIPDVSNDKLKKYFKKYVETKGFENKEYPILNEYFDITKDKYLVIPLANDRFLYIIYQASIAEFFESDLNGLAEELRKF